MCSVEQRLGGVDGLILTHITTVEMLLSREL